MGTIYTSDRDICAVHPIVVPTVRRWCAARCCDVSERIPENDDRAWGVFFCEAHRS